MTRIPDKDYKPDPKLSPWLQGKEAQWDLRPEECNPYRECSEDWREWVAGYREAREESDQGR